VEVLIDLRGSAVFLGVGNRTAEHLAKPSRNLVRVVGGHVGEDRCQERILGYVSLIQETGHAGEGWEPAAPFEQGGFAVGVGHGVAEVDVPVHAAAEGLVLGVAAAAERVVLVGGAVVACQATVGDFGKRDTARDAVWSVLGVFHGLLAVVVPVDVATLFLSVERVAEGSGRAVTDGADDLVHAPTAGRHEGLLVGSEHGRETVTALAGVLAGAAVVEDRDLDSVVGVAAVGD